MKKKHIRTKAELARKLDISRPTLNRFLVMSGAPTRTAEGWDLEKTIQFIAENSVGEAAAEKSDAGIRGLRMREIGLRCQRLQFRLDVEKKRYVLRSDICAAISRILSGVRVILREQLENQMPSALAGLDVPQIRCHGKRLNDLILVKFQELADFLPE